MPLRPSPAVLAATLSLALTACDGPPAPDPAAGTPPAVIAEPVSRAPLTTQTALVGRVTARDKVDLRARVEGFLKERPFDEGQQVGVGDLLFVIEPEQYASVVSQREADLAAARADEQNARAQLARGEELLRSKNIPASKVDELRAAQAIAAARIAQADAALAAARLDLGYTRITAPVAGRIGKARYSVGSLVGPGSEALATIVSADPIEVEFPVTQRDLLAARRGVDEQGSAEGLEALLRLPDDSLYEHKGRIDFVDVTTNAGTDTVTVRARFPNPDRLLVDGQYLGVLLQRDAPEQALTVPQAALQIDQQGVYVLVVDGEQRARVRRIQTGALSGPRVVVTDGLAEGDLVITDGAQKVRPGQPVSASPPQALDGVPAMDTGEATP